MSFFKIVSLILILMVLVAKNHKDNDDHGRQHHEEGSDDGSYDTSYDDISSTILRETRGAFAECSTLSSVGSARGHSGGDVVYRTLPYNNKQE